MKRILGTFQKHLMIFGLSNNYVYSSFGLLIGIFSTYQNFNLAGINVVDNKIETFIIMVSIFTMLYKFTMETKELKDRSNHFLEIDVNIYRDKVRNSIGLIEKYEKNGYEICDFNNEKYVMSKAVNRRIYLNKNKLKVKYIGEYILADETKEVAPFALNKAFESKRTIFNSGLIRLADDLCLAENCNGSKDVIRLQRTNYFQGLCTNELVYSKLRKVTNLYQPFVFEGRKLMLDSENKLLSLCESHCSNYLGGSTLAVTKDNYIILNKQSDSSHANPGRLAPSGSGSTDYKDYKRLKEDSSFQDLATITMEREFREECNLTSKRVKINSRVIGFARLLERGGKPDFFGVTYLDANHDIIERSFQEIWEIGEYDIEFVRFKKYKEIPSILYRLIREQPKKVSIQIHILAEILKELYDDSMDVYGDLRKQLIENILK